MLPYEPGSPYRAGPCRKNDHACVDGLTCSFDVSGNLTCSNSNLDDDGSTAFSFHEQNYCPARMVAPLFEHGPVPNAPALATGGRPVHEVPYHRVCR